MYRKFSDIPYTTLGEGGPSLDIYLPEVGEGPFPVVVYFHGGSYTKGDKSEEKRLAYALPMLKGGYAVAALNYSLAPKERFPKPIVEGKAAVRFLRAHASSSVFSLSASINRMVYLLFSNSINPHRLFSFLKTEVQFRPTSIPSRVCGLRFLRKSRAYCTSRICSWI
jgi:hypothetical protein